MVGASEVAFSANGPLGKKTTYLVSVRRSYLQFLFKAIGLPFLPTYTDAQFKIKHQIDKQNEISFIGLGALDDMKLNTGMKDMSDENKYILEYLPVVKQRHTPWVLYTNILPDITCIRSLPAAAT